uniref:Ventricular natriuretic peptide n=2 Tax=Oncorhynchus mykiss TaxID=8022 RepID=A0A8C7QXA4_ONCMY|nr:ventricular natriuretic peptide-like [Oncorhynchus nerka]
MQSFISRPTVQTTVLYIKRRPGHPVIKTLKGISETPQKDSGGFVIGMAKLHIFLGYIVLITTLSVSCGTPYASRNVQELENLKDLIQRLEDKLTVNEENYAYPSESEDVDTAEMEDIEYSPTAIRGQEERMTMNAPNRIAPESPVVSRLKDLIGLTKTAKSFNSCFGNRIERIGSWSGLGCNNVKTGNKKRIFGN